MTKLLNFFLLIKTMLKINAYFKIKELMEIIQLLLLGQIKQSIKFIKREKLKFLLKKF